MDMVILERHSNSDTILIFISKMLNGDLQKSNELTLESGGFRYAFIFKLIPNLLRVILEPIVAMMSIDRIKAVVKTMMRNTAGTTWSDLLQSLCRQSSFSSPP